MKREEIIAKWAGMTARERDAWVAEVVFGWAPLRDGRMRSLDGFMIRSLPEYTTDIAAAWEIEAQLFPRWTLLVKRLPNGSYGAAFMSDHEGKIGCRESAPEAICLAALIAKLTEVPANESA